VYILNAVNPGPIYSLSSTMKFKNEFRQASIKCHKITITYQTELINAYQTNYVKSNITVKHNKAAKTTYINYTVVTQFTDTDNQRPECSLRAKTKPPRVTATYAIYVYVFIPITCLHVSTLQTMQDIHTKCEWKGMKSRGYRDRSNETR
jgi:hypothetical protein